MDSARAEALTTARKLVRTLDAAPNPLQQAQAAVAVLLRATGWPGGHERKILELADWLAQRPPPATLKARFRSLLETLD